MLYFTHLLRYVILILIIIFDSHWDYIDTQPWKKESILQNNLIESWPNISKVQKLLKILIKALMVRWKTVEHWGQFPWLYWALTWQWCSPWVRRHWRDLRSRRQFSPCIPRSQQRPSRCHWHAQQCQSWGWRLNAWKTGSIKSYKKLKTNLYIRLNVGFFAIL